MRLARAAGAHFCQQAGEPSVGFSVAAQRVGDTGSHRELDRDRLEGARRCGNPLIALSRSRVARAWLGRFAPARRHSAVALPSRSEEHTSELQSLAYLVCRLLLEKKKKI